MAGCRQTLTMISTMVPDFKGHTNEIKDVETGCRVIEAKHLFRKTTPHLLLETLQQKQSTKRNSPGRYP